MRFASDPTPRRRFKRTVSKVYEPETANGAMAAKRRRQIEKGMIKVSGDRMAGARDADHGAGQQRVAARAVPAAAELKPEATPADGPHSVGSIRPGKAATITDEIATTVMLDNGRTFDVPIVVEDFVAYAARNGWLDDAPCDTFTG